MSAPAPPPVRYTPASDGHRIAWSTSGQGYPTIVMVAGWLSHLGLDWQSREIGSFHRALAQTHRVILYDRPGVGLSDRNATDFGLDYQVDCVRRVLDASGEHQVALFARGFGGPVAMAFAATFPERVSQLALFGSSARMLGGPDYPEGISLDLADGMERLVRADWGVARGALAEIMLGGQDPERTAWFSEYLAMAADAATIAAVIHAQVRLDVEAVLPKIAAPVLVMHNRDDRSLSVNAAHRLARLIPTATLMILEGSANQPFYGDQATVLGAIEGFMAPNRRLQAVAGSQPRAVWPDAGTVSGLTPREREVAAVVAEGLTNRQIAERLYLSERTVESHVGNILGKLGLHSRSQLAAQTRAVAEG